VEGQELPLSTDLDRRQRFEAVADVVYEPLQRYFGRRVPATDVSELLDDALLVIWRRPDQVPLDDPLPWSYGVARRCLANHRRGQRRRLRLVGRLTERAAADRPVQPDVSAGDDHPLLHAALAELDEPDRELIRLWAWEQLEPREIAVVLDTTANAVSLRLSRLKHKIAASIERQDRVAAGQRVVGHGKEPRT
jgi:RNA polymerase sigma-70 factor (ECF subfamily)